MTKSYRPKLLALCLLSGISLAATAQETTPFKLKKVTSVKDRCIYAFEQLERVMTTYSASEVFNTSNSKYPKKSILTTIDYKKENLTGNESYLWRIASKGNYFKIANYIVQNNCYLKVDNDNTDLSVESGSNFTWQFASIGNDEFRIMSNGNKDGNNRILAYYGTSKEADFYYKAYKNDAKFETTYPDYKITLYQLFEEVKVKPAGLATYVSDKILDYTNVDGLKAYKAKVSGNHITFDKVGIVPAAQGVLLRATNTLSEETAFDIPVLYELYYVEDWSDDNDFIRGSGAAVQSQSGGYYNYILNSVGGNVGFYHANGQTVATNRAYLRTTTSVSGRMSMDFDDDPETTNGIHEMTDDGIRLERDIYDLQGRHVTTPRKGLYIINGKKMVIK